MTSNIRIDLDTDTLLEAISTLLTSYIDEAERQQVAPNVSGYRTLTGPEKFAQHVFFMKIGVDPLDANGVPLNTFSDLMNDIDPVTQLEGAWVGPISASSLTRVLQSRIVWESDPTKVKKADLGGVLSKSTIVDYEDLTVAVLLERIVFVHNADDTFRSPGRWGITGLQNTERRSAEVSLGIREVGFDILRSALQQKSRVAAFRGVSDRARREANVLIMDQTGSSRPQAIPIHPALILSVAYTIEYLLFEGQDDDLSRISTFIDASRPTNWNRLALPALRLIDPTIGNDAQSINRGETISKRCAKRVPWLVELMQSVKVQD